jgi:hypothetical protein
LTAKPRRFQRQHWKWALALASLVIAVATSEALLRFTLFNAPGQFASQDPAYYARTSDELWIYRYLFSSNRRWAVASGQPDASLETNIEFYKSWSTSLMPDAQLGYVRKPGVHTPCHETTNLGTRSTHNYSLSRSKLVFLGDSFVESAACSNDTLTTKLENLTGIDTLNYGIGGYGLDQIFLYFTRVLPDLNRKDCLFLIGLIQDDMDRVLLKVRTSPKPYFTISDNKLVLHTDHIHPSSLNDYYYRPPERFYLYYFLRGRLGFPYYQSVLNRTRTERQEAIYAISRLLFKEFSALQRQGQFRFAFVIFPTPGAPFDTGILSLLREQRIPVIDLQACLHDSDRPDTELYAELHPTSLGNALLAQCLVRDLATTGLLN